jgi:hypothetical protein
VPKKSPLGAPFILPAAVALAISFLIFASVSSAQGNGSQPDDAIRGLQALQPEAVRTRVLVLATFHLRQIEKTFKPQMLDSLRARLEQFRPDAICVESLSGSRTREFELRTEAGPFYREVLDGFASRHRKMAPIALSLLKTSPEAAAARVRELLAAARTLKPREKTPDTRANLALWLVAAYEPASAALQWSYLTDGDKRAQKTIPSGLAADLEAECAEVNEVYALAAPLARSLGLETLEPVDDFEDLDAYAGLMPQLEKDVQDNPLLAAASKAAVYAEAEKLLKDCIEKGDLWPQYALLNSPPYARADVNAQWGVFLRTHFPGGPDRARLGLWENRNLKIAARIRAVAALHPGGHILVIYGAAHKPFLDAYLSMMADVKVGQVEKR